MEISIKENNKMLAIMEAANDWFIRNKTTLSEFTETGEYKITIRKIRLAKPKNKKDE